MLCGTCSIGRADTSGKKRHVDRAEFIKCGNTPNDELGKLRVILRDVLATF